MYGYPEYTKQSVAQMLSVDEKWTKKALIILYKYQTEDEKDGGETVEQNGQGFNYHDAPILTLYAQLLLKGASLKKAEIEDAQRLVPKYAGQILKYIQCNPNHQFI